VDPDLQNKKEFSATDSKSEDTAAIALVCVRVWCLLSLSLSLSPLGISATVFLNGAQGVGISGGCRPTFVTESQT